MAGIFDPGIFDSGIFDTPASGTSFTANAVLKTTLSGSFTASAFIQGYFKANAVLKTTFSVPRTVSVSGGSNIQITGSLSSETLITGMDLSVPVSAASLAISWDVFFSHNQNGTFKHEVIHLRRDSVSGTILATSDPQGGGGDGGDSSSGNQFHAVGSFTDSSPTTGHYVLSIVAVAGSAAIWSASRSLTIVIPGLTADAAISFKHFTADAYIFNPGSFTTNILGGSLSGITANKPAGTVEGDTLIAFVGDRRGNATTVSPPDGTWIAVAAKLDQGQSEGSQIYIKPAGPSEPSSYTFTWSANTDANGGGSLIIYRDSTLSVDVSALVDNLGLSSTWSALTATPTGTPDTGRLFAYFPTEGSMTSTSLINTVTSGWVPVAVLSSRTGSADTIGHTVVLYTKTYSGNAASGQMDVGTNLGVHYQGRMLAVRTETPTALGFTADAVIRITRTSSLTANAVIRRVPTNSFTANAFVPYSLKANALIKSIRTGSYTLNAMYSRGHFRLDAFIRGTGNGSFTVNATFAQAIFRAYAVIRANARTGSYTVNALRRLIGTGSFTANANYVRRPTGSFTANALIRKNNPNTFTIDYATWSPGVTPTPPLIGVPTRIFINGTEMSNNIIWKTATFTAKVNSQTGECSFDVVDRAHNLTFEFGDEVHLYIGGVLKWGGWIFQVNRKFAFEVQPSPTTRPRIWHIVGTDYNRFLDRRILHDDSNPGRTWDYAAGTNDDVIFNDLWNYFDTTGFTKNIQHVADGVLDIKGVTARTGGNVATGGFSMRDVLLHLSWDTGAIFYVTPQKVVTYVDADLVSSPYTLTDQPSGPLDVGFHDVRILEDSTEMVNDSIVWGAGKGSANVVESRYQSVPSQTDHGVWQDGNFTAGIYKQATADAVARARVEGSPVSKRGAKNPKRAVELLTWSPVFDIGDVVHFHDSQFFLPPADPDDAPTHNDILPIRTMTITWPTPTAPLFAIQMSWEIDAVWSMFDPWLPVGAPAGGGTPLPPGGGDPPPGCVCGITDTFSRTVVSGWGQSDMGAFWSDGVNLSVNGTEGVMPQPDLGTSWGSNSSTLLIDGPTGALAGGYFSWRSAHGTQNTGLAEGSYHVECIAQFGKKLTIGFFYGFGERAVLGYDGGSFVQQNVAFHTWGPLTHVRWETDAGEARMRWWADGDAEPTTWLLTATAGGAGGYYPQITVTTSGSSKTSQPLQDTLYISDIDLSWSTRCDFRFDDFRRSVGSGWGQSSSGPEWTEDITGSGSSLVDSNGYLYADSAGAVVRQYINSPITPLMDFTAVIKFHVYDGTASAVFVFGGLNFGWKQSSTFPSTENHDTLFIGDGQGSDIAVFVGTGSSNFWNSSAGAANSIWGFLKVERVGAHVRAKLWGDANDEPDWMVEGDLEDFTFLAQDMVASTANSGGGSEVDFGYIDLFYDGKPCYQTCVPTSFLIIVPQTGGGVSFCGVQQPGYGCSSQPIPDEYQGTTFQLYAGATYRLQYRCHHGPADGPVQLGLSNGIEQLGPVGMGSSHEGTAITFTEITATAGFTSDYYFQLESVPFAGYDTTGLQGEVTAYYVSGPDPRFYGLPAETCVVGPVSSGGAVPGGTSRTDNNLGPTPTLTALGTATGSPPIYPPYSQWQATNAILPGLAVLLVDGVYFYGGWLIFDADAGIIQITVPVFASATISLSYITNGSTP